MKAGRSFGPLGCFGAARRDMAAQELPQERKQLVSPHVLSRVTDCVSLCGRLATGVEILPGRALYRLCQAGARRSRIQSKTGYF